MTVQSQKFDEPCKKKTKERRTKEEETEERWKKIKGRTGKRERKRTREHKVLEKLLAIYTENKKQKQSTTGVVFAV